MFALYFGNPAAAATTILLLLILFIVLAAARKRASIQKWGRLTALIVLIGTAVSALSATRDGYAVAGALFPMNGAQSLICMVAGFAIFLTGIICLFIRKQGFRRAGFFIEAFLMAAQVVTVEGSRIAFLIGGRL
jgi:hypothetical protein